MIHVVLVQFGYYFFSICTLHLSSLINVLLQLGVVYMELNEKVKAFHQFEKALAVEPDHWVSLTLVTKTNTFDSVVAFFVYQNWLN